MRFNKQKEYKIKKMFEMVSTYRKK